MLFDGKYDRIITIQLRALRCAARPGGNTLCGDTQISLGVNWE